MKKFQYLFLLLSFSFSSHLYSISFFWNNPVFKSGLYKATHYLAWARQSVGIALLLVPSIKRTIEKRDVKNFLKAEKLSEKKLKENDPIKYQDIQQIRKNIRATLSQRNDFDPNTKIIFSENIEAPMAGNMTFSDEKLILFNADKDIPDGVFHHEYGHIKHNHGKKRLFYNAASSISTFAFLEFILSKAMPLKGTPSLWRVPLKFTEIMIAIAMSHVINSYFSRNQEFEADQEIPVELRPEMLTYLKKLNGVGKANGKKLSKEDADLLKKHWLLGKFVPTNMPPEDIDWVDLFYVSKILGHPSYTARKKAFGL